MLENRGENLTKSFLQRGLVGRTSTVGLFHSIIDLTGNFYAIQPLIFSLLHLIIPHYNPSGHLKAIVFPHLSLQTFHSCRWLSEPSFLNAKYYLFHFPMLSTSSLNICFTILHGTKEPSAEPVSLNNIFDKIRP